MIIKNSIMILIAFGGGVIVGGAMVAFITILQILPRLAQFTETEGYLKLYQLTMIISIILSIVMYFANFNFGLPAFSVVPIGFFYGVFIGILSSALAEVLNVIPVISKKIKIKHDLKYIIWALIGGKVMGSLIYWIYLD
ncbi:MAG: stage V sporulation protein AB [Tissierellaceae bacterium]|nr:stage V sporulation protein AB [Tissierellaceae bacterium]